VGRLSGINYAGDAGSTGVRWVAAGHYLASAAARAAAAEAAWVLRPRIAARFPLSEAGAAHRLLADRSTMGKVLLTVPGSSGGR
jgi:NADPH2:quinone reductase